MAIVLRIVCWNIAEGSNDSRGPANSALPAIAKQIRERSPDIVLLNEARVYRWPFGSAINQFQALCDMTGLAYYDYGATVATGWTGWKCVGVLSRYPILSKRVIPVMRGTIATAYATCEVTVEIAGLIHHIFATRFDAWQEDDNVAAHQQSINLLQGLDPNLAVIFGGDFNANMASDPQFVEFVQNSRLTYSFLEHPDPLACIDDPQHIIDHVFYRGPYRVAQMELRCPWGGGGGFRPSLGFCRAQDTSTGLHGGI